ncbi:hypothetical protein BVX93_02315, partial [bacterium B13(2017)]
MEIQVGQQFLNYKIEREIGKGGFGSVFFGRKIQANPDDEDKIVAIKVLHKAHADDERLRLRFHREARLARKLSHPNVVKIFDNGIKDDVNYIVMEFARGKTMLQFLVDQHLNTYSEEQTLIETKFQEVDINDATID